MIHCAIGKQIARSQSISLVILRRLTFFILCLLSTGAISSTNQLGESGAFRVEFKAADLFTEQQAKEWRTYISMDRDMTWEIFVPETYDPSRPAGVLTYVSPIRTGLIPENWKPVLAERNLIWISGNKAGNNSGIPNRSIYHYGNYCN